MAWTTPSTWVSGAILTAAQLNQQLRDNLAELSPFFASWTSYTPTLSQGASSNIAKTLTYSRVLKIGRLVIFEALMTATAAGTAGSNVTLTLPHTAAVSDALIIGNGYYDDTGTAAYGVVVRMASATTITFQTVDGTGGGSIGSNPNIAVANGDILRLNAIYESAS